MTGKTILVIDTDTETIQKIMSVLEPEGYLVFTASDKDVSIKMAKKINPSLIYVNIGISGASGLEICKVIHDTETLKDIPIVIITPHEGAVDSRHRDVYGIVDSLKTPFKKEEIISLTRKFLETESIEEQMGEEEIEIEPIEEELDIHSFEEKTGEPLEEEIEVLPIEDETVRQSDEELDIFDIAKEEAPVKEEIEVHPMDVEKTQMKFEDTSDSETLEEEKLETVGDEEGIEIPTDDDLYREEDIDMKSFEEEMPEQQIVEEPFEPIEEQIDKQIISEERFEEEKEGIETEAMEGGEAADKKREPEIEEEVIEETQKIGEEIPEETTEDDELSQMLEEAEKEETKEVPSKEEVREAEEIPSYKRRDNLYRGSRRKTDKGSRLLVPIIIIVLLLAGGGFLAYKSFIKEPQMKTPVVVKRQKPPQQISKQVETAQEQKRPERQTVKQQKQQAQVTVTKTQTKPAYSVQIGAYKNKSNADAIVKLFKQKGYDAFTRKSVISGKGTFYKVLIGKFQDKRKAIQLAKVLRTKEKINTIIYRE